MGGKKDKKNCVKNCMENYCPDDKQACRQKCKQCCSPKGEFSCDDSDFPSRHPPFATTKENPVRRTRTVSRVGSTRAQNAANMRARSFTSDATPKILLQNLPPPLYLRFNATTSVTRVRRIRTAIRVDSTRARNVENTLARATTSSATMKKRSKFRKDTGLQNSSEVCCVLN